VRARTSPSGLASYKELSLHERNPVIRAADIHFHVLNDGLGNRRPAAAKTSSRGGYSRHRTSTKTGHTGDVKRLEASTFVQRSALLAALRKQIPASLFGIRKVPEVAGLAVCPNTRRFALFARSSM
jgi:hypothetical protein